MTKSTRASSTTNSEETSRDHLEIRCPRLGGQVTFGYCRREAGTLPCPRTIICWQARFPVAALLQDLLTEEDWERWTQQSPKEKMVTLLESIEAARERLRG